MSASMMRIGAIGVLFTLGMTVPGTAQNRVRVSGGAEVRVGPVRARVAVRPAYRDRYRDEGWYREKDRRDHRRGARGRWGLAVCQEGHGHPRFGWSWCVNEGYLFPTHARAQWVAVYPRDVVFQPLFRRRSSDEVYGAELRQILGWEAFRRLEAHRRNNGVRGPLWARWEHWAGGGVSLVVYECDVPLAEYRDQDRDQRVDVTFLYRT